MRFKLTIDIDAPRDHVVRLFLDPTNLRHWQPGLVSHTPVDGAPGTTGATAVLVYGDADGTFEMHETIVRAEPPELVETRYEAETSVNRIENRFAELPDGGTRWTTRNRLRLGFWLRILGLFFPGQFRRDTFLLMARFKLFAEEGEGALERLASELAEDEAAALAEAPGPSRPSEPTRPARPAGPELGPGTPDPAGA